MLPIPNGYVPLIEAFKAVGRESYGESWVGDQADRLAKLTASVRYKGPKSDSERQTIEAAHKANEQRWDVFTALQRDFLGTPPDFDDAVAVYLLKNDGQIYVLPPRNWINDNDARLMLASGRNVSGSLLIVAEASLPGRGRPTIPQIKAAPLQTPE